MMSSWKTAEQKKQSAPASCLAGALLSAGEGC